jgi:glycosyltransferase involved in cell wall biosynthesis
MSVGAAHTPRVTVLMPVYNGGPYLAEAIGSILGQSFRDFELLAIDDGSADDSAAVVRACRDPRIRLVENGRNLGLIATLNKGLELARGEYVARMDCDDISLPERLARQVAFLDTHPEVGVCGTWFRKFGARAKKTVRWETDSDAIRAAMLFSCSLAHPTVMLRRDAFASRRLHYDAAFPSAEDYDLWVRAMAFMEAANLPEVLVEYRVHPDQVTQRLSHEQVETAGRIRLRQLRVAGFEVSPDEFRIHQALSICDPLGIDDVYRRADQWLCSLKRHNDERKVYAEPGFSRVLLERWLIFAKKCFSRSGASRTYLLRTPEILHATGLGRRELAGLLLERLRG